MGVQYCHPMKLSSAVKTWLLWLALSAAFFPIICFISYVGLMIYGSQRREAVTSPAPSQFPILVITSHYVASKELLTPLEVLKCTLSSGDDASVVLQENLAAFTEKHKDYTFLVPPGAVEELNRQLRKQEAYNEPVIASVHVTPRADGREEIHLDASIYDDLTNESWYEASAREFNPKFQRKVSSLGASIAAAFLVPVPAGLLSVVAAALIVWIRSRRKRAARPPAHEAQVPQI